MNTRSLPNIGLFSKRLAFLKTFFPSATAPLRDQPFDLEHQSDRTLKHDRNSKQIEVLRHLEQTYRLERRNFL
ncbi:hypothetical protein [Leptolyngbya ohadii]|uniref:hypothetical protein n=1 Tax=Leptolyngbya ohadii TaxID=1962290 RepID=UPI000B59F73E|nr:hypothetical protein [Leptolyngbya ohadii]